ncbi:MAG: Crp/Fnr family transcriptional regulator [Blastochloris sp.]|nr:Crp/Fnr family transcriptional regulator [Blastochloris sp.]
MVDLVFLGRTLPDALLLTELIQADYSLSLSQHLEPKHSAGRHRETLIIVSLESNAIQIAGVQQSDHFQQPWIAWNRTDDAVLALQAYAAGASAVLPRQLTAAVLMKTITTLYGVPVESSAPHRAFVTAQQRYQQGALIPLESDSVLTIVRGVVAQIMLRADGSEALIGLHGPRHVLLAHPDDDCALQLLAHTDVIATVQNWRNVVPNPRFAEQLRTRIHLMEAWSAMQARPHANQRILGLLGLLAEQFGVPHGNGVLIDVRLTHAQLATAIGATRSTVTRLLGELRLCGVLMTQGKREHERFCLSDPACVRASAAVLNPERNVLSASAHNDACYSAHYEQR